MTQEESKKTLRLGDDPRVKKHFDSLEIHALIAMISEHVDFKGSVLLGVLHDKLAEQKVI